MRKKCIQTIAGAVVITLLCVTPISASVAEGSNSSTIGRQEEERNKIVNADNYSSATLYGDPRGSIISTATVGIKNLGDGEIEVLIETMAQKSSDEIRHTAILERQEADGSWTEIIRYEFEALKKDYPNEELPGLTNQFKLKNVEIGYYYRIRGIHYVWLNGKSQGFSTATEAMLLTKYVE